MKCWFCVLIAFAGLASAQEKTPSPRVPEAGNASLIVTVYVVSGFAEAKAAGSDVPADLAEVLKQMQGVFAYKSYKLVDALVLRSRNGNGAELEGALPDDLHYDFKYNWATIQADAPHTVKLDGLRLAITRPHYNRTDTIALVAIDLDTRDGQKTVVGKSAVDDKDAIFLVIVPRVTQ